MELTAAIVIVAQDVRESFPELSRPLAIKHALETTAEHSLNQDDPSFTAYKALHQASTAEVILAMAHLECLTLDRGDVLEVDGVATIDGMNVFEWLDLVAAS
jgi:hypothetical protein